LCGGGFIEELPPPSPNDANQSLTDSSSDETNDFSSAFRLASSLISPLLFSTTGARPAATDIGSTMLPDNQTGGDGGPQAASTTTTRPLRRPRGRYGMQTVTNFDNILQDILLSVTNDGGNGTGAAGGTPLFFMGNPGDYAWGREGLDTIVTQLLNQMDNTGQLHNSPLYLLFE
jgi:E3 ubiquitin-protein ligase RNF115/126